MSDKKVIVKIKKLLALAKSSNPHEAAAALNRAQALMQKYSVEQQDLDLTDCETRQYSFPKQNLNTYETGLLNIVADAFGISVVVGFHWKTGKLVAVANLMGITPQPELAAYCLDVVYRQLVKARSEYIGSLSNRCKRETKIRRGDDFAKGWLYHVSTKVHTFAISEKQQDLISLYKAKKYEGSQLEEGHGRDRSKGKAEPRVDDVANGIKAAKDVRLDTPMHGKETPKLQGVL